MRPNHCPVDDDDARLRQGCRYFLSNHKVLRPSEWLRELASMPVAEQPADFCGNGGAVQLLEARTAALLGKEQGRFFIKGMIAQLTALKCWSERRGSSKVAIHPLGHMDMDEAHALERVGGLVAIRLGRFAPFGLKQVQAVEEGLAAVVVELPLRRAGFLLPPLDELRAISAYCREREIPLRFDGARIWEAAAGYGVGLADLASLADSLYVSFYKGLGGPAGAMLCGTAGFIGSVVDWKSRYGGNLMTAFPYALGGLAGLDRHLPRMPTYVARARQLAARLEESILLSPAEPHVNSFQLLLQGPPGELSVRNRRFAEKQGVWLFNGFGDSMLHGYSTAEIVIGDCSDEWSIDQAASWLAEFSGDGGRPIENRVASLGR